MTNRRRCAQPRPRRGTARGIAIELHYWENFSATEIAEVLDVPVPTVKGRLERARRDLEARMREIESDAERLDTTLADLEGWAMSLENMLAVERPLLASPTAVAPRLR